MKKNILFVLFTFIGYAAIDVILGHLLFKEEINIIESLITSALFCLIYFPAMHWFTNNQKVKEDSNEKKT